jgi:uncharacterized protein (TIRG00374 family)
MGVQPLNAEGAGPAPEGGITGRRLPLGRWTIQVVATSGFTLLALSRVDLQQVGAALERANYAWAAAALFALTAGKAIAAVRWKLYLGHVGEVPVLGLLGAYVIGTFLNSVFPLRAGDFAKIQLIASRYGLSRAGLTSSVFAVEAVLDLFVLVLLLLASLAFVDSGFVSPVLGILFIAVACVAFLVALLASRLLPRQMPARVASWVPGILRTRVQDAWPGFLEGMDALRDSRLLARAISLHLAEWVLRIMSMWFFSLSFTLDAAPGTYVVLTAALAIVTLVPVAFMNIGTYQVTVTEVMSAAGASRSEALAYGLAAHGVSHLWIAVMGLIAFWTIRFWPRPARSTSPGAGEPTRDEPSLPSA